MKKLFTLILIALLALPTMNVLGQPGMPTKEKKLYLTVFLQGLYNGVDMNKTISDPSVPDYQWPGTIVDTVTVELHDAADYTNIVYTAYGVNLNQDGTTNTGIKTYVSIPSSYNGDYYITVKTRNHVETTTAASVLFNTASITYDFSSAATQAFADNQVLLAPGVYGIYLGDINQDGNVLGDDFNFVFSAFKDGITGYSINDINGDGNVLGDDFNLVFSAFKNGVAKIVP